MGTAGMGTGQWVMRVMGTGTAGMGTGQWGTKRTGCGDMFLGVLVGTLEQGGGIGEPPAAPTHLHVLGAQRGHGGEQGCGSWAFGRGRVGVGSEACGAVRFQAAGMQSMRGAGAHHTPT